MIRVAVVDDQELVRDGFALILDVQEDMQVIGQCADGVEAVDFVREHEPDVILMDIRMPHLDGIEATRRIVASGASTRVLVLTTYDLDEYVYDALRHGASGYLLKTSPRAVVLHAVRAIASGDVLVAPTATRQLIEASSVSRRAKEPPPPGLATLTPREHEVLRAVATGASNLEIGGELFISEATVKTHVAHLLEKLAVRDRVQLVVLAFEHDLVR